MRAVFAFLILAVLAAPSSADTKITNLQVRVEGGQALVSLALEGSFGRRFKERLESGLPTTLIYRLELHRDRQRWWDQKLAGSLLEITAMYDAVARTYTVHSRLDEKLIESRTLRDRPGLEAALRQIDRIPVFDLTGFEPGRRMLLKAQAVLGSRTVLSFIPVSIETDWEDSNKFRAPSR
jgi:hypothetical protein